MRHIFDALHPCACDHNEICSEIRFVGELELDIICGGFGNARFNFDNAFPFQLSNKSMKLSGAEADKLKEVVQLRKEMSQLNMVDEFAKYAKIQRKVNQLTADLERTGILMIIN